jgi:hypothetical protein
MALVKRQKSLLLTAFRSPQQGGIRLHIPIVPWRGKKLWLFFFFGRTGWRELRKSAGSSPLTL